MPPQPPTTDVPPPAFPGRIADGEIEIVDEPIAWENAVARLYDSRVRYPGHDGAAPTEGRHFRLAPAPGQEDGVVVAPVDEAGRILLVRQFRHPVRRWMTELPRGGRDAGETPEQAAARELREEVGGTATAFAPLGRLALDSGQLSTVVWLVAARVRRDAPREPEDSEAIARVLSMPYDALRAACERGEIIDGPTIAAVLRLAPFARDGALALPWRSA